MNKALKKTLKIIGIVLAAIVGLFLLLYLILFFIGLGKYGDARDIRKYVCVVPEINSGWAPQGIAYTGDGYYIQTGYDGDNNVVVYFGKGESFKRIIPVDDKGKTAKGHAGGVACTKDNVYIANDYSVLRLELSAIKSAKAGGKVTVAQTIAMDNRAAYCYSDDSHLYIGEFYRAGNYETDKSHYYTTPSGEKNKAIVSCYALDGDGMVCTDGVQPYPEYCISVTGLVQGFAIKDGTAVLSRSYGLVDSELQYHTLPALPSSQITVSFKKNETAQKKQVPLYYLDGKTLFKTLTLPSFSEDITIVNDRVVVTNESAANKYIVGKLFGANKVYSYPLYKKAK
ncbi:MAG: hypothetical protein K2M47_01720 [Clostridiales bacterium]|nr:hypothetical protein [Clostridiales bacterium]